MVDIRTVGAGGGSIAFAEYGGFLRVGPESAGATPGPACYGRGGTAATVTDAQLLLGRLNADDFAGGAITLDPAASERAVANLADAVQMSTSEVAAAIVEVVDRNVADALRLVSIDRGRDPRDFPLVAFGGAGPLHAVEIARAMGIGTVLIPWDPATTSALGLSLADFRVDVSQTLVLRTDAREAPATISEILGHLRTRAASELRREGSEDAGEIQCWIELRYYGQNYQREIPLPSGCTNLDRDDLDALIEAFHADYRGFYGYAQTQEVVEVVGLRCSAGVAQTSTLPTSVSPGKPGTSSDGPDSAGMAPTATRVVTLTREEVPQPIPVFSRNLLPPGFRLRGPALVDEPTSTTFLPTQSELVVMDEGTLRLECHPSSEGRGDDA
jgi:N-methylhydantoinase A